MTVAFSAALHYVSEYASMRGYETYDHPKTEKYIQSTKELRPIGQDYSELYQYSCRARYFCPGPNDKVNDPDFVTLKVFPKVKYIRTYVARQKAKLSTPQLRIPTPPTSSSRPPGNLKDAAYRGQDRFRSHSCSNVY